MYSDRQRKCHRRALYLLRPYFLVYCEAASSPVLACARTALQPPGALDRTLLCRSRTRRAAQFYRRHVGAVDGRLIKIERGFHASGMNHQGGLAMKQDRNAKVDRRDLLRALGASAVVAPSAQMSEAQADSENKDEKRKARYQADSADVKAFYRVNNYPK